MEIAPHSLIVGPSGSGKTSSLRNLDPSTTWIIAPERKTLPFKGRFPKHFPLPSAMPKDPKNIPDSVIKETRERFQEATEDKSCRLIVIDSFSKWEEYLEQYHRMVDSGWDIWNNYNSGILTFLDRIKCSEVPVVLTAIDEIITESTTEEHVSVRSRRVKVMGSRWEGKVEKEFSHVFFTDNEKEGDGRLKYQFLTNSDGTCSAKTPMGMFEELRVENDLQAVMERMEEFYGAAPAAVRAKSSGSVRKVVRR